MTNAKFCLLKVVSLLTQPNVDLILQVLRFPTENFVFILSLLRYLYLQGITLRQYAPNALLINVYKKLKMGE